MSRALATDEVQRPAETRDAADLYEHDLYGWIAQQVALLRAGRLDAIDADHLAEELEGLARAEFNRLRSALRVLVMHMLKWDQQPEYRSKSWMFSIREQRDRVRDTLTDNPSLGPRRDEALRRAYPAARDWAANETNIPEDEFPVACPYDWDDLLQRPFEMDAA